MAEKDKGQPYAASRDRHSPGAVGQNYDKTKDAMQPLRPGDVAASGKPAATPGAAAAAKQAGKANAGAAQAAAGAGDSAAKPGAAAAPPAPAPNPEQQWQEFCKALPEVSVRTPALALAGAERDAFRGLNPVQQRNWAGLDAPNRSEFLTNPSVRSAIGVIVASQSHLALYQSLPDPAARAIFRGITPDERGDFAAGADLGKTTATLLDPLKLQEWRTWRNIKALQGHPDVALALALDLKGDPAVFAAEVDKLSLGWAGERVRRLISENGFEVQTHRDDSLKAVRDGVKAGQEPEKALRDQQPNWTAKGKLTKNDGQFGKVPMLKACAWQTMVARGTLTDLFTRKLLQANTSDPRCPKNPDGTVNTAAALDVPTKTAFYAAFRAAGGRFDPSKDLASYAIRSATPYAYWMFDAGIAAVIAGAKAGIDVIKACAIEESPEYNLGFTVVQLPPAVAAGSHLEQIRRPTVWDGLQFDQFAAVTDPSQCHGVTTGGTGEVMVGLIDYAACQKFKEFAA